MMNLGYCVLAMAALAGCSAEKSAAPADNAGQTAAPAAVGSDFVAIDAVRSAFTQACPMAKFVEQATCEPSGKADEYNCKYVLVGEDALGPKPATIAKADGAFWKFVEEPADCKK